MNADETFQNIIAKAWRQTNEIFPPAWSWKPRYISQHSLPYRTMKAVSTAAAITNGQN